MRPYTIPLLICSLGSVLEIYPPPMYYGVGAPFGKLTAAQCLASDWIRVGQTLYSAMNSAGTDHVSVKERQTDSVG